ALIGERASAIVARTHLAVREPKHRRESPAGDRQGAGALRLCAGPSCPRGHDVSQRERLMRRGGNSPTQGISQLFPPVRLANIWSSVEWGRKPLSWVCGHDHKWHVELH